HRGVVKNFVLGLHDPGAGETPRELGELVFFAAPHRNQLAAAALHGAHHAVDMVVAHAADGKLDVVLWGRGWLRRRGWLAWRRKSRRQVDVSFIASSNDERNLQGWAAAGDWRPTLCVAFARTL